MYSSTTRTGHAWVRVCGLCYFSKLNIRAFSRVGVLGGVLLQAFPAPDFSSRMLQELGGPCFLQPHRKHNVTRRLHFTTVFVRLNAAYCCACDFCRNPLSGPVYHRTTVGLSDVVYIFLDSWSRVLLFFHSICDVDRTRFVAAADAYRHYLEAVFSLNVHVFFNT